MIMVSTIHRWRWGWGLALLSCCLGCQNSGQPDPLASASPTAAVEPEPVPPASAARSLQRGIAVLASQVDPSTLERWTTGYDSVVVVLEDSLVDRQPNAAGLDDAAEKRQVSEAVQRIREAGLAAGYFIEVARNPRLAQENPQWMGSLQTHPEWRMQFPDFPETAENQVVKTFPWVPILYQETFAAHLQRLQELLTDLPVVDCVYLNDLQGSPSACGCGHPLCRWTADYGPLKTATPLGQDAAANFLLAAGKLQPSAKWIPIFVSECEAEDEDDVCCGVACFEGRCWKDFTQQLDPLAKVAPQVGVACFYKAFQRDLPRYGKPAGFIEYAIDSFQTMPQKRKGVGVAAEKLVAVLQGWDVSEEEIQTQIQRVIDANAAGYLLVVPKIEQSWEPRMFNLTHDADGLIN